MTVQIHFWGSNCNEAIKPTFYEISYVCSIYLKSKSGAVPIKLNHHHHNIYSKLDAV